MRCAHRIDLPCDVIIVLGAAVWPDGQPSPALRQRLSHAIHALQSGMGERLLVTGGLGKHPPAEAHLMQQLALAADVPCANIHIEDQSTSTWQSAEYCTRFMRRHGWSTALIVTDRFHLPRALLMFRSLGVHAMGSAPPAIPYAKKFWKRYGYRIRETLAFAWYLLFVTALNMRRRGRRTEPT